jgi:hypothetical protein
MINKIIFFLLFSSVAFAQTWQQSQDMNVELGVRDKFGNSVQYEAYFVVTKDGQFFRKKMLVKKDAWGFVYFPKDFNVNVKPGMYQWKCLVDNKKVASGKFNLDNRDFIK